MKRSIFIILFFASIGIASCGGGDTPPTSTSTSMNTSDAHLAAEVISYAVQRSYKAVTYALARDLNYNYHQTSRGNLVAATGSYLAPWHAGSCEYSYTGTYAVQSGSVTFPTLSGEITCDGYTLYDAVIEAGRITFEAIDAKITGNITETWHYGHFHVNATNTSLTLNSTAHEGVNVDYDVDFGSFNGVAFTYAENGTIGGTYIDRYYIGLP